ncbi:sigma-54-dependent transcriptional regulator [Salinispira pacifica]
MTVCIVDDIRENARYVERILTEYTTHVFDDAESALEFCSQNPFDVIVADQKMPRLTGIELIMKLREKKDDFAALLISAYTDSDDLIDAVNSNLIYKYVVKPFSPHVLLQHVNRAVEWLRLSRTNQRLQEQLLLQNRLLMEENQALRSGNQPIFDVFTGTHQSIKRVRELTQLYAGTNEPVLISGETGTGKELLARVVHTLSERREKPFVPLNCSAIQESILESELFGYEKGAFTGATRDKKGIFQAANGGTIFLDEIGDLPLALQPKLLRVLQFGTFIPVGGVKEVTVDIRVISATNKDLDQQVERGLFREDLLYRINAFHIGLPPLRERATDLMAIIERITASRHIVLPDFTPEGLKLLENYPFPGNIRELGNIIERLDVLCRSQGVTAIDAEMVRRVAESRNRFSGGSLAEANNHNGTFLKENRLRIPAPGEIIDLSNSIDRARRDIIAAVFEQEGSNISRTALRLGMSRQGLKNSLKSYGLIRDIGQVESSHARSS